MRLAPAHTAAVTWRTSVRSLTDVPFVVIPVVEAAALVTYRSTPLIAIALWWTANTVSHNFIHRPLFSAPAANTAFSLLLSAVMGIPQTLWRQRHLAHHASRAWQLRWSPGLCAEVVLLSALWAVLATLDPSTFLFVYVPGWLCGLALCVLQGRYEHAGGTTSHYGRIYNALCFNDGYHAEHHAMPGLHWTQLPLRPMAGARTSRWPPLLRWLELVNLNQLERLVLHSAPLRRFVLRAHRRAFEHLLPDLPAGSRIGIVGGGLFPRTALILRDLFPSARIVIIDCDSGHLESARSWVGPDIELECRHYPSDTDHAGGSAYDLLVIPLAYDGDRNALYLNPPARLAVHDWIWRRHGHSCIVSFALFKRLNLLTRAA